MNSINHVVIGGNLTRDPELRYTPQGTAVCDATIANNESWTSESGEKKERVTFVGLVIWGKTGEAFAQYHRKGSQVLAQGRLTQETWDDKETGKKREKTKVRVDQWFFVGSKPAAQSQAPAPAKFPPTPAKPQPVAAGSPIDEEDDVPF
jgi:single-strand DNA-binding protein